MKLCCPVKVSSLVYLCSTKHRYPWHHVITSNSIIFLVFETKIPTYFTFNISITSSLNIRKCPVAQKQSCLIQIASSSWPNSRLCNAKKKKKWINQERFKFKKVHPANVWNFYQKDYKIKLKWFQIKLLSNDLSVNLLFVSAVFMNFQTTCYNFVSLLGLHIKEDNVLGPHQNNWHLKSCDYVTKLYTLS